MNDLDDETDDTLLFEVAVPLEPAAAYDLFVRRFGDWWPAEFTFSGEGLAAIGIEDRADGRCFERAQGGKELVWGTVVEAAPARGLMFHWHITPEREIDAREERSSTVTILFAPDDRGTIVRLQHADLSRHGKDWARYRAAMASEQGWPYCLEHFRTAAR
jgi:hypothetical protein